MVFRLKEEIAIGFVGAIAIPVGPDPTVTVAETVLVEVLITETVLPDPVP